MISHFVELTRSRDLLWSWTVRELKVRYSQSVMGSAWAILQPLALMIIFTLVFSIFLKIPTNGVPYAIFAYTALLPWTFLASSLTLAIPSLVNNMNLVSKIYFPREVLPIASITATFVDFLIGSVTYIILMAIYHIQVQWTIVFVPLLILIQIILTLGVTLFASALNVFYRDIRFIIPLALQVWMYLSPVIYSVETVPEGLRPFYFLNPMAILIDSYRRVILFGLTPDWPYLGLAVAISLLIALLGYRYFKSAERSFADLI
jgi:lipopolysaccharide transport system permease protein